MGHSTNIGKRQREAFKAGPWWAGEAADSNNYEQREHKT
jgi:hypothetical protein